MFTVFSFPGTMIEALVTLINFKEHQVLIDYVTKFILDKYGDVVSIYRTSETIQDAPSFVLQNMNSVRQRGNAGPLLQSRMLGYFRNQHTQPSTKIDRFFCLNKVSFTMLISCLAIAGIAYYGVTLYLFKKNEAGTTTDTQKEDFERQKTGSTQPSERTMVCTEF